MASPRCRAHEPPDLLAALAEADPDPDPDPDPLGWLLDVGPLADPDLTLRALGHFVDLADPGGAAP